MAYTGTCRPRPKSPIHPSDSMMDWAIVKYDWGLSRSSSPARVCLVVFRTRSEFEQMSEAQLAHRPMTADLARSTHRGSGSHSPSACEERDSTRRSAGGRAEER